jgi:hypothetical protein
MALIFQSRNLFEGFSPKAAAPKNFGNVYVLFRSEPFPLALDNQQ